MYSKNIITIKYYMKINQCYSPIYLFIIYYVNKYKHLIVVSHIIFLSLRMERNII